MDIVTDASVSNPSHTLSRNIRTFGLKRLLVISELLKSIGEFFLGFFLEKYANITDISASTQKIITQFGLFMCWNFLQNNI